MTQIRYLSGILTLTILIFFSSLISAQTYRSPELQKQEEEQLAKKIEWIKANPEAYRAQGGNPDDVRKFEASNTESIKVKTIYPSPVAIDNPYLYKLTSVNAIDIDHKHTDVEMMAFQKEAVSEWNKMNIVIDWEAHQWYYIPRNTEKKPLIKSFQVLDNKILFTDCKDCQSNGFVISEQTDKKMVVQLRPQDEGQYFVYQYEFKK